MSNLARFLSGHTVLNPLTKQYSKTGRERLRVLAPVDAIAEYEWRDRVVRTRVMRAKARLLALGGSEVKWDELSDEETENIVCYPLYMWDRPAVIDAVHKLAHMAEEHDQARAIMLYVTRLNNYELVDDYVKAVEQRGQLFVTLRDKLIEAVQHHEDGKLLVGATAGGHKKGDGPKQAKPAKTGPRRGATKIQKMPSAPRSLATKATVGKARVTHRADGVHVQHTEFVRDILSDVDNVFAYDILELNPANGMTFPWLSTLASRFESYRFKRLRFYTVPSCSTGQAGNMILAVDYDAADPIDNTTKVQMLSWEGASSTQMWERNSITCGERLLNKIGPTRFTTSESRPGLLYNAGNLYVATTSTAPVVAIGGGHYLAGELAELWVEYELDLTTPQIQTVDFGTLEGDRKLPYGPQLYAVDDVDSVAFSGGRNLIPISMADTAVTSQAVNDLNKYKISITQRTPGVTVNEITSETGVTLAAGQAVMKFDDDFEGEITIATQSAVPWTTAPTLSIVEQYGLDSGVLNSTMMNDRPDFLENRVLATIEAVTANTANYIYRVYVAAGTLLRFTTAANYALGVGMRTYQVLASPHRWRRDELLKGRNCLVTDRLKLYKALPRKLLAHEAREFADLVAAAAAPAPTAVEDDYGFVHTTSRKR